MKLHRHAFLSLLYVPLTALYFVFQSGVADAGVLLTTEVGYAGRGLNLSAFANGNFNFQFGPTAIDGFTFTAAPGGGGNSGLGSVVGQGAYGLGSNGTFGGSAVYIGVDSGTGYAQLLGTVGYSQMGFFMNYAPTVGNNATISTLNAFGVVIESFDLTSLAPIATPGGVNAFAFRGVSADLPESIYGLRFGGNYLLVTGTADGNVPRVPEPSILGLIAMALLSMLSLAILRQRAGA